MADDINPDNEGDLQSQVNWTLTGQLIKLLHVKFVKRTSICYYLLCVVLFFSCNKCH